MWPIALGFLLLGLLGVVIVCSGMNDPAPHQRVLDAQPQQEILQVFKVLDRSSAADIIRVGSGTDAEG